MHTIYSKIIWEELNLKDYKLHKEDPQKTEQLILDWVKDTPIEKVDEVLGDLSWVMEVKDDGFYDGTFYAINQRNEEERPKKDGEVENDMVIHQNGIIPSLLFMSLKTGVYPEDLRFIANILEIYYKK